MVTLPMIPLIRMRTMRMHGNSLACFLNFVVHEVNGNVLYCRSIVFFPPCHHYGLAMFVVHLSDWNMPFPLSIALSPPHDLGLQLVGTIHLYGLDLFVVHPSEWNMSFPLSIALSPPHGLGL